MFRQLRNVVVVLLFGALPAIPPELAVLLTEAWLVTLSNTTAPSTSALTPPAHPPVLSMLHFSSITRSVTVAFTSFTNRPALPATLTTRPLMLCPLPSNIPLNAVLCVWPSGASAEVVSLNSMFPVSLMFATTVVLLVNTSLCHLTNSSMLLMFLGVAWL